MNSSTSNNILFLWRCYHPDNWKPDGMPIPHEVPALVGDYQDIAELADEQERFDGFVLATSEPEKPKLSQQWEAMGWHLEAMGSATHLTPGVIRCENGMLLFPKVR